MLSDPKTREATFGPMLKDADLDVGSIKSIPKDLVKELEEKVNFD